MNDLTTRLERLAAEATRDTAPPEPAAVARRGRRRRRRQLAGTTLLVAAAVAAGLVLPSRLASGPAPGDGPATASGTTGAPAAATDLRGARLLVGSWAGRTDVSVFLADKLTAARRDAIRDRIQALEVVDAVFLESRQEAYDRFKELYRDRPEILRDVTPSVLPESFRVRLDEPRHAKQLLQALCRPGKDPSGKQRCIAGVDAVVDTQAALKPVLVGAPWQDSTDVTIVLAEGVGDAERAALQARVAAVDGVRTVTYESPAAAVRRIRKVVGWKVRDDLGPTREMVTGSLRVTLDDSAKLDELHRALCRSKRTGDCDPAVLVVLRHPRAARAQALATGAGRVRVRP